MSGDEATRIEIELEAAAEYYVDDQKMEVVEIPVGYTHNIENLGSNDMVTIMWANEKFDPHKHQAISMLESELAPGTVVSVLQKGYLLNDRVLRPALVTVAKAPEVKAS